MPDTLALLLDWPLVLAVLIVFGAGVLRGFSGFGSALVLAPSLSALYGPAAAVPLVMVLEVALSFQLLPAAWKLAERRSLAPLSVAAIVTIPLGAWLLIEIDPQILRWIISGVILLFLLLLLAGIRREGPVTLPGLALTGAASGLSNGATGVSGPPVMLYYLAGRSTAAAMRANVIVYFFVLDGLTLAWFAVQGLVSGDTLLVGAMTVPTTIIGVWLGSRLFTLASERVFRIVAYTLIAAVAVVSALVG